MLPENPTVRGKGQQPLRQPRRRIFLKTGRDGLHGRDGGAGRDAYRMRQAGKGHTEVSQAAFLLRGLQDIHAPVLRDRQLVPYHRQAHGRENLGGDTQGTGHDGIRPGEPEIHCQKKTDHGRRGSLTGIMTDNV